MGKYCLTTDCPTNLYNNTRMRTIALAKRETTLHDSPSGPLFHKNLTCAYRHHTSWCSGFLTEKGWSSDFPPLPSAFSSKRTMASMLRSHNGVHCCGTVGDSHPSSQLIAAKRTLSGDSRNHDAKIVLFSERTSVFSQKLTLSPKKQCQ